MTDEKILAEIFEAGAVRREARRDFLRVGRNAAMAGAGVTLLAACGGGGGGGNGGGSPTPTPTPAPTPAPTPTPTPTVSDVDVLNFALNLEYLEAQFYSFAAFGTGLPANLLTGSGTQGAVTGGQQVPFNDPLVAQYAREIAIDERNHVAFLRQALGSAAVAQPALNISATGSFAAAAQAAGLVGAGQPFNPYANDNNFLLGAYIFEDVGVTAYKGASPLITNKVFLEAAAGILAAEAYHAGLVRTVLFRKGLQQMELITATEQISDARDSLDGPEDKDQGVAPRGEASNIVPADANAVAFSRTTGEVLNIVYLTRMMTQQGGFFPNGVNGTIRTSDPN